MSSFLYKKIWHGISIHTRKCIPIFITKQPRNRFGSWVSFYLYDIILKQASFKDGGRFLTGGGSYGLHHYERIIGT